MNKKFIYLIFIFFNWMFCALPCAAVDISFNFQFARQGNNILAALTYEIPEEYHAYSHVPGETGKPTDLDFTLEEEGSMPVLYPTGSAQPDIYDPQTTVNVYEGPVTLLAILPAGSTEKSFTANIDMLLCSQRRCLPYKQSITGHVPKVIPLLVDVDWKDTARKLLDSESDSSGSLLLEKGTAPPPVAEIQKDDNDHFIFDFHLHPRFVDENLEIYSLWEAILFGLLAGLLLNAMPCVLPVLTFKISGLLLMGNAEDRKKLKSFREHNICFALGILTFFTLLAFLLGAADMMWGELYQYEGVVLAMLLLVFLMGLSMLGVFTLPAFDLRIDKYAGNPMIKAYCTGFVSTFLATPCSGPLLGGALAWAFTQPLLILLVVFWAIGVGMSLPYFVFSLWPSLTKILPRPGNWMHIFEHVLGFLLLGTALYLLSILPEEKRMQILSLLLIVSLCAWLWGKFCGLNAPPLRKKIAGSVGILVLGCFIFWIMRPPAPELAWRDFAPQEFATDLGRKNMLVEFTADWCPNCKFLEATVLTNGNIQPLQRRYDLELVKVDLTQRDKYGEKLLQMLGSKSIPLAAIFSKGESALTPLVLRDIYTRASLVRALKEKLEKS